MTSARHHGHFAAYPADAPVSKSKFIAKKHGVLRRIFDAIVDSRQKQADERIARWLGRAHH